MNHMDVRKGLGGKPTFPTPVATGLYEGTVLLQSQITLLPPH